MTLCLPRKTRSVLNCIFMSLWLLFALPSVSDPTGKLSRDRVMRHQEVPRVVICGVSFGLVMFRVIMLRLVKFRVIPLRLVEFIMLSVVML